MLLARLLAVNSLEPGCYDAPSPPGVGGCWEMEACQAMGPDDSALLRQLSRSWTNGAFLNRKPPCRITGQLAVDMVAELPTSKAARWGRA